MSGRLSIEEVKAVAIADFRQMPMAVSAANQEAARRTSSDGFRATVRDVGTAEMGSTSDPPHWVR